MNKISFDNKEVFSFVLTAMVLGFILSFRKWGVEQFDFGEGLANLIVTILIVAVCLYIKIAAQKYAAFKAGFHAEYSYWKLGLIIGFLLTFLSNGEIPFIALGFFTFAVVEHLRVGHKYGLNQSTMALISFVGIITLIVLAIICKFMYNATEYSWFLTAMQINLLFAFFAVLPIPVVESHKKVFDSEGLIIMFRSRTGYVGVLALTIFSILGLLYLPIITGIVLAVVCSALTIATYYIFYENK